MEERGGRNRTLEAQKGTRKGKGKEQKIFFLTGIGFDFVKSEIRVSLTRNGESVWVSFGFHFGFVWFAV